MECVAYMRVSTEKQAEEGNGLDSQKRDIELFYRNCRKWKWLYHSQRGIRNCEVKRYH